uniref:MUC5A protein n=1 Tax=Podarcis muralis TaxID=64176 RepID=A0A670IBX6_PODMU
PMRTTLAVKAGNPAHNGRVCSTWGNFHFKTFDGDIYHFPGTCNYVFSSHCKSDYEDFNIQIRRSVVENAAIISHIIIKIDGAAIELTPHSITVNAEHVQLPYSHLGILMETVSGYLKIVSKLGLVIMWNQEDGLLLELNEKYANQTCGLCGDFNGISTFNEFVSNNIKLNPVQFGNMQKMDGPTEECQDPAPSAASNCSQEFSTVCQTVLTGEAFMGCNALVEVQDYIDACVQDLCSCDKSATDYCICNTFAEYSRQCAHAGGLPMEWRTEDLCAKTCPFNMVHQECGSPCSNTCTNPERSQLCEDHCTDGCFCPPGTVFDDISSSGCIAVKDCHCTYNGDTYSPGASFASQCTACTCTGGQWACVSLDCPGMCSVEGGSHISTFDEKRYSVFGDCSYVLTKLCDSNAFTVLGDIRKCGLTDTETCLKGIAIDIDGGETVIVIKSTGVVYVNMILSQLPISASNVTIFRPSSFFIVVDTKFGLQLQIQLVPIMQLFVRLDPTHKDQTCGLCGNFNNVQADDFKAASGVVEGTSAAFANTWKAQANCPDIKNIFENPCTLSIENEKYASHWCGLLTDSNGPFQKCHSAVDPTVFHTTCMFDTCNCERSEDCMCAALSSYVRACAAKGVLLSGWRTSICTKYQMCPKTLVYRYNITSCQPTCRSLSEPDVTCNIKFTSVDGCTCEEGMYMDESGKCVPATSCPCYYKGTPLLSGEVIHENGVICTCTQGKLQCIGEVKPQPECFAPMVYFDCTNATVGATGAECQKSCQTLDMGCYSTQCISGCMCPKELVSDGQGGCVAAEECPCIHNEATYKPGDSIKVKCNTCTCKNRKWECSTEPCLATCSVYGDGHYITFDGKRYSFSGDCEYTLVQDHCGKNNSNAGTFRVITENIPCGTTGTTCSKAIKVFMGNYELILADEKFTVVQRLSGGGEVPFKVRYMGIYMVIDTTAGLVLLWDKKTSIFIKLNDEFKGQVCGLCGNYDGNDINDFTTRSQSVVGDVLEFGNSWKVSPTCPDAPGSRDPCSTNPYRSSWAQKQCSIINSKVFASCHSQVEPTKYYEACISDACACDTGGDCECFCTAVAAYAQACNEAGSCISWRTPNICPLFCDYYNPKEECEWHYQPCGSPCMKTCRNPSGKCLHELQGLEGCYPKCPADKPYFDEDEMQCVDLPACGCFDGKGNHYKPGEKMPSQKSCQVGGGTTCPHNRGRTLPGNHHKPGDVIYNTTDGIGGCITAICSKNGTIERNIFPCTTTPTTTTTTTAPTTTVFNFSSTSSPATTTAGKNSDDSAVIWFTPSLPCSVKPISMPVTTSVCVQEVCQWSQWYDVSQPGSGDDGGDFDTFEKLRAEGYKVCRAPRAVACRAEKFPNTPLSELGQKVECSKTVGLICYNKDQHPMSCHNYQIKIQCCSFEPCGITASTPGTTHTTTPTTLPVTTPTPVTTPNLETTTISTTAPLTPEQCTKEVCEWSQWYDISYPGSAPDDGDFDTFKNIRAKGYKVCKAPKNVECRAERYPDTPLNELEQKVTCSKTEGLICYNKEQLPPICYNYEIRIECLNPRLPKTTTTQPTTTTTTPRPVSTTTLPTSTVPVSTTTTETTTTSPETTTCGPICQWTGWFDVDYPTSGPNGGDIETYNKIRAVGGKICAKPSNIQCRAENHPDLRLDQLGQKVECSVDSGLVCKNDEQIGKFRQCLNYEIRVLCCEVNPRCPPTTIPTTTTPKPTTTAPETTTTTPVTTTAPKTTTTQPTTTTTTTPKSTTTVPTGDKWVSNCTVSTCEGNNKISVKQVQCPPVRNIVCENGYPPIKVFSEDGCCYHYECECVCSGWGDPHYITFDGTYYTFLDNCTYVLVQQITPKYDNFRVLIDNYFCDAEDGLSCPQSIIVYYKTSVVVLTRKLFDGVEANKIYFDDKIVNPGFQKDGIFVSMVGVNMVVEIPELGAVITFSGLIFSIKLPYSKFGNNTEGQCGTCTNDRKDECRLPTGEITSCPYMAPHWKVDDEKKNYCKNKTVLPVTPTPAVPCKPSPVCDIILSEVFSDCHQIIPPKPFHQGCSFDSCHIVNTTMQCSGLEIYASLCASKGVCIDWRAKTNGSCRKYRSVNQCHSFSTNYTAMGALFIKYFACVSFIFGRCVLFSFKYLFFNYFFLQPGASWISNCQECTCEKYTLKVQCTPKICATPVPARCEFEGFVPVSVTTPEDKCCPQMKCGKYNLLPDHFSSQDPESQINTVECVSQACDKNCPVAQEYKEIPGQCCGKCSAVACVIKEGSSVQPGEIWNHPGNNCTTYECELIEDQYIPVPTKRPCAPLNCPPSSVRHLIRHNGCEATEPVELRYCEGHCGSSSIYSSEANTLDYTCACCKETKTSKRQVTLMCPDRSTIEYSYIHVDSCECVSNQCDVKPSPTPGEQEQQQQQQEEQQQQQQEEQQQQQQQEEQQLGQK